MDTKPLIIETQPADKDIKFLDDQISEFNFARTGIRDSELLAIFVRNTQNEIVAGLYGWTWGGSCQIQYLWVHETLRGQGYGRRLLAQAEDTARARGCTQVVLDTHSFEAPGFYQKQGYEIVGVVENYPRGYQQIYLRKQLGD